MIRLTSHRNAARTQLRSLSFAALLLAAARERCIQSASRVPTELDRRAETAGTEIAPRGQREVKDITYGDWKKLCFKPGGCKNDLPDLDHRHVRDRPDGGPPRYRRA